MNQCNIQTAVAFVQQHVDDCAVLAKRLNVPVENILGLEAHESQHGIGRIAVQDNNYFSLHAPAPLQITGDPKTGGAANYAKKVADAIAMVKLRMAC